MSAEPFYIRQTAEPEHTATKASREAWVKGCWAEARNEGAKDSRVSWLDDPRPMILVEAWKEQPFVVKDGYRQLDYGEPRWSLTYATEQ